MHVHLESNNVALVSWFQTYFIDNLLRVFIHFENSVILCAVHASLIQNENKKGRKAFWVILLRNQDISYKVYALHFK